MEKQSTPVITIIFYIFGGIFLIVSAFMLITAIGYTKTYLQSYDASFSDMWSHSLQYIIAQCGPYLGFGIVCIGIGKVAKEMKGATSNQSVTFSPGNLSNTEAYKTREENVATRNDLAERVSFLAEQIEATREVLGIKIEEKEKRDSYRLEELGKKIDLVDKAPVVDKAPTVEETPAVEEVPTVEETPVVEEVPTVEETPAVEEVPTVEETPAAEEVPTVEETPAVEDALLVEETSIDETEPVIATNNASTKRIAFPAKEQSFVQETNDSTSEKVPQIMRQSDMMAMPEIPTPTNADEIADGDDADAAFETINFDAFASRNTKRDTFSKNELKIALAREEALHEADEAQKKAEQEKK